MLFEKRLGWNLYRPIGEEWFTRGYWKIAEPYGNYPGTIRQYLSTEVGTYDPFKNLNGSYTLDNGIYNVYDPIRKNFQKAITYEKFMSMKFDFIVSSIPAHDEPFARLARERGAKHIAQMGNIFQGTNARNVICSCMPFEAPDKHIIFYHQEFPLDIFNYVDPIPTRKIKSFVMLLPSPEKYEAQKAEMPDFEFKAHGMGCPDGVVCGLQNIAMSMKESMFGWHIKPYGDGFGHIIHNWAACGRPIITDFIDYYDKLAGKLLIDGVTAINVNSMSPKGIAQKIRFFAEPERHQKMCEAMRDQFKKVVDFEAEFIQMKQFLNDVV
jgi:hypothetical protein